MNLSFSNDSSFTDTNISFCEDVDQIKSISILFECYLYFSVRDIFKCIFELGLSISIVSLNLIVIIFIYSKKGAINVFDKILLGHSIVDGLTGLLDVPLFHVYDLFNYWPFGKVLCMLWSAYDNNMNTITNLHMLYMTWVRVRSIKAPTTYTEEFLIKRPYFSMILIWIIGFTIWIPIDIIYLVLFYEEGVCQVSLKPYYSLVILNIFLWFMPLFLIFILTYYVGHVLGKRKLNKIKRKKAMLNRSINTTELTNISKSNTLSSIRINKLKTSLKSRRFKMGAQTKLTIIIATYWTQWTLPCLITLIDPICNCVSNDASTAIYWLTYTVTLTDPIIILLLNPNIAPRRK